MIVSPGINLNDIFLSVIYFAIMYTHMYLQSSSFALYSAKWKFKFTYGYRIKWLAPSLSYQ